MSKPKLAIRILAENPDHHLWNNHGTWWLHCTIHLPGYISVRIRRSLRTRNLEQARIRRDQAFLRLECPGR